MTKLAQDIRFGVRSLRRRPGFTAVIGLTLALGIGASTAIYSVVNAVLLRPLPYAAPDRLVLLRHRIEATGFVDAPLPPADVMDFRDRCTVFDGVAATDRTFEMNLTGDGPPIEVRVAGVTANFFEVLGAKPALGRTFDPLDDRPLTLDGVGPGVAPPNRVVISHGLWQRRFGSDSTVVGASLILNGFPNTIIGVMPRDFRLLMPANAGMPRNIDVWAPTRFDYRQQPRNSANANRRVIARLREGVSLEQAQEEVDRVAAWQRKGFEYHREGRISVDVKPMHADIVRHARPVLLALLGAVGLVLLIACANVANLLLVQGAAREREIAIRAALGGDRRRIVRLLMTESALLAALGGVGGLLLARWGVDLLLAVRPANLPRVEVVEFDLSVLLFTVGIALLSALLFGAAPALQASRLDLHRSLKERGTLSPDPGRRRFRSALVVFEVALSIILLISAGLMARSFVALQRSDLGFAPARALSFRIALPVAQPAYGTPQRRAVFFEELESRLVALPGVVEAGAIQVLPLSGRFWTSPYRTEWSRVDAWMVNEADYRFATPGYFEAIGARLVAGRTFTPVENAKALPVVVVDRTLAARAWPGQDPVGRKLEAQVFEFAPGNPPDRMWLRVVGVVENIRGDDPSRDGRETIYFPYLRQGAFQGMTVVVRTEGPPETVAPLVRKAVAELDPDLPVAGVRSMESYAREAMAPTRFAMTLIGVFAGVAVVLASVGLYGVVASLVRQRRREIGLHMAFGAGNPQILRMVLWRGVGLAIAGVVVGLAASLALTRLVSGLLTGVTPTDPLTYAAVGALITAVTLVASVVPAQRAARIDPMEALRYE